MTRQDGTAEASSSANLFDVETVIRWVIRGTLPDRASGELFNRVVRPT